MSKGKCPCGQGRSVEWIEVTVAGFLGAEAGKVEPWGLVLQQCDSSEDFKQRRDTVRSMIWKDDSGSLQEDGLEMGETGNLEAH